MRDTAAHRQADCFLFLLFTFSISFLFRFFCFSDRRKATPNETLSTFLGSLGQLDWPRNTRHGMAIRLPHLAHSGLHLLLPFPFLLLLFFMFGIWVYIFLDGLYQALGSSVRARRTTSCAWCCIRCHSVMSYLGLLFLLTLLLAFGHACTAVDGYDLCSNSHCFSFFFFFLFLFRCFAFLSKQLCLALFPSCTITS
ncbi:hypothetical protein V8C43DRAFT_233489 [Trichoderma afarasin]